MNKKIQAHIAVLFANILFSINYQTVKLIVPSKMGAPALNICRVLGCVILFWLFYFIRPRTKATIDKKDIPRFLICAAAGIFFNQILFIKGLSLTSAIHASLLALATPIIIIFIAAWVLKDRLSALNITGIILGICGALILILMKDVSHTASNIVLGDIFIVLNAISYALYFVLVKPLMLKYSPLHVIRWVFTIGLIFMLPYCWSSFMQTNWQNFTSPNWISLGFIIVGGTFLSYLFNLFGVSEIGASATGSYIYTQPVFATLIAMLFAGEKLGLIKIIAAILIFGGVYFANYKSKKA